MDSNMEEWKVYKIGDICSNVCSGGTPTSTHSEYYDGDIPWLNTKEICFNRIHKTERNITEEGLNNSSAKWIPENTVIVAMYGATAGKTAIAKIPLTTNQACCNLTINSEIADYRFVYYYLLNKYSVICSLANGGAQQNLNAQIIKDFKINLPPTLEQTRIASFLSSLDDKIEINKRINDNLEQQAQTLFKSWFVDFEPFKDQPFEESELGMIPKGWRVGKLGDICSYSTIRISIDNLSPKTYFSTENMLPNKMGAVEASTLPQVGMTTGCEPFDVLVSNIRPYFKKILRVDSICGCSSDVMCFHSTDSKYRVFLYRTLYDDSFFSYIMAGSKGTKMPRGDKQQIMKYPIVLPHESILEHFSNCVEPMLLMVSSFKQESSRLAQLRDTLLPKLMSGELKINDVEKNL